MVDRYSDSFNEHSDGLLERREAADFDNLQHTLSGVETGQQTRHGLNNETDGSVSGGGKRKSLAERIRETLDWLLLNDPAYRQAHENLMTSIRSAQQTTQTALDRVMSALAFERTIMEEILSNAAKLPDGTKVFKDKKGGVRNEDGEIIPLELIETIQWSGNEPTYEEYLAQRRRIESLEQAENELRGIETELGEIHTEATDEDNPPTIERIDDLQERIKLLDETVAEKLLVVSEKKLDPDADQPITLGASDLSSIPKMPLKQ